MKANNLIDMKFGTLTVISFDEKRHQEDLNKRKNGEISRVRRYWNCHCSKCGKVYSIRGENLLSGNTVGCVCDMHERTGLSQKKENVFEYDKEKQCYKIYASNTNNIFFIDEDDYENVKKHCWYETTYGYMMTRLNKDTQIMLHRYIILGEDSKYDNTLLIDHISRDRRDNRRCNLRISNPTNNARNISMGSNNTSGITGVSLYKPNGKWRAFICVQGKFLSLGYYHNKEDAIKARKEAEIKYFGEFAPQ